MFAFRAALGEATVALAERAANSPPSPLVTLSLTSANVRMSVRNEGFSLRFALARVDAVDECTPSSLFRHIIAPLEKATPPPDLIDLSLDVAPIDARADTALVLKIASLYAIASPALLDRLLRVALQFEFNKQTSAISDAASDDLALYAASVRHTLAAAVATRQSFDVQIQIDAPRVVLPSTSAALSRDDALLVVDLGSLRFATQRLADGARPYDDYALALRDVRVVACPFAHADWRALVDDAIDGKGGVGILSPLSLNVALSVCAAQDTPDLFGARVDATLSDLLVATTPSALNLAFAALRGVLLALAHLPPVEEAPLFGVRNDPPLLDAAAEVSSRDDEDTRRAYAKVKRLYVSLAIPRIAFQFDAPPPHAAALVVAVHDLSITAEILTLSMSIAAKLRRADATLSSQPQDAEGGVPLFCIGADDATAPAFDASVALLSRLHPQWGGVDAAVAAAVGCAAVGVAFKPLYALQRALEQPHWDALVVAAAAPPPQKKIAAAHGAHGGALLPVSKDVFAVTVRAGVDGVFVALLDDDDGAAVASFGLSALGFVAAQRPDADLTLAATLGDATLRNERSKTTLFASVRAADSDAAASVSWHTPPPNAAHVAGYDGALTARIATFRLTLAAEFFAALAARALTSPLLRYNLEKMAGAAAALAAATGEAALAAAEAAKRVRVDFSTGALEVFVPADPPPSNAPAVDAAGALEGGDGLVVSLGRISVGSNPRTTSAVDVIAAALTGARVATVAGGRDAAIFEFGAKVTIRRVIERSLVADEGVADVGVEIDLGGVSLTLAASQVAHVIRVLNNNLLKVVPVLAELPPLPSAAPPAQSNPSPPALNDPATSPPPPNAHPQFSVAAELRQVSVMLVNDFAGPLSVLRLLVGGLSASVGGGGSAGMSVEAQLASLFVTDVRRHDAETHLVAFSGGGGHFLKVSYSATPDAVTISGVGGEIQIAVVVDAIIAVADTFTPLLPQLNALNSSLAALAPAPPPPASAIPAALAVATPPLKADGPVISVMGSLARVDVKVFDRPSVDDATAFSVSVCADVAIVAKGGGVERFRATLRQLALTQSLAHRGDERQFILRPVDAIVQLVVDGGGVMCADSVIRCGGGG
jgi:hypothetical protein